MKKQLKWVDIVKGFAIVAVVAWHTSYDFVKPTAWGAINQMLGTFWHVPIFLCIVLF